ncbi:SRPBCC family protein [Robertkochia aurantiaca]|uniref:SRPBCC family protein n=1 Tax=Robertkochia aurantiaca TaxID=2873700 RepID=UPI001CCEFB9C|nr:SRPBCC domain-containing protein [Robertkochia sp. 3YJGBD-33]
MSSVDFTRFTKKIYIKAPLPKIYWSWSTEEGITSWFLRAADFTRNDKRLKPHEPVREGDTYTWMWYNWDGSENGKVLAANQTDHLVYSFADSCQVAIDLKEEHGKVLLTLHQFNIPTDDQSKQDIFTGCSNGWTFWLTNLKAYMEHGILLNETHVDLSDDESAPFEFVNM